MIQNLNELAKFVKGGADVLQKAIDSKEEVSLEFVDGKLVTESDLEEMKESVRNDAKKEGQNIGYDFAMKDMKKDFGINIEGKDRKTIVEAIKANILEEAGKEPNKKISELETSLSNLQSKYESDIQTKDEEIGKYKGDIRNISIMSELQKNIPEVKGLSVNQFLTLAKTEYSFDLDESGSLVAMKGGQPVKDNLEKLIPVKNVLTDFATQNGWFNSEGRGGKDVNGGKKTFESQNDVYKYMYENNINPMSAEGEKLLNEFKN